MSEINSGSRRHFRRLITRQEFVRAGESVACEQGSNETTSEKAAGPQCTADAVEKPIRPDGPCAEH